MHGRTAFQFKTVHLLLCGLVMTNQTWAQTPLPVTRPVQTTPIRTVPLQTSPVITAPVSTTVNFKKIPAVQIRDIHILERLSRPSITKVGAPTTQTQNTPNGQLICSVQRYNVRSSPPEYAMKTLDQDKLWVGAFVRLTNLELGSMQAVNIPAERRLPYSVTSALPTTAGSASINPTQSAYNQAIAQVRQGAVGNPYGSTIRYEITEQSSADTSALKMGLKASGIGYSVSAAGSYNSQNKQNRISAAFVQNSFTMNADLGGRDALNAFLKDPASDAQALSQAAYIDSITYGRLLVVEMTSSYSSQEMRAALEASYASVSGSASAETKKVLSESRFNVYAAGGNEQSILNLIRTQQLGEYFRNTSDPRTLVPISFTARNFNNGTYAASASTGEYAETVCNPNSVKASLRITYRSIEPEDSKYDDVYGELSLDGNTVWERRKEQRTDLYKGQTMTLYNSGATPLTLNYGEARQLRLIARLMDYDSTSADDVIGLWNTTIDLRSVADAFKNGKTRVVHEFRKRGEADADGVLILEFSRN